VGLGCFLSAKSSCIYRYCSPFLFVLLLVFLGLVGLEIVSDLMSNGERKTILTELAHRRLIVQSAGRDKRKGVECTYAADPLPKLQTRNGQSMSHEDNFAS
jgi:hypothetical protein